MTVGGFWWIDARAGLLARLLQERYGYVITADDARAEVSDVVDGLATALRIRGRSVLIYVTEESITDLADRIGREATRAKLVESAGPAYCHLRLVTDE